MGAGLKYGDIGSTKVPKLLSLDSNKKKKNNKKLIKLTITPPVPLRSGFVFRSNCYYS